MLCSKICSPSLCSYGIGFGDPHDAFVARHDLSPRTTLFRTNRFGRNIPSLGHSHDALLYRRGAILWSETADLGINHQDRPAVYLHRNASILAGGETSSAAVERRGVRALRIGPTIDPGVPWTFSLDKDTLALALKSGNFGAPDFFTSAFNKLPN